MTAMKPTGAAPSKAAQNGNAELLSLYDSVASGMPNHHVPSPSRTHMTDAAPIKTGISHGHVFGCDSQSSISAHRPSSSCWASRAFYVTRAYSAASPDRAAEHDLLTWLVLTPKHLPDLLHAAYGAPD